MSVHFVEIKLNLVCLIKGNTEVRDLYKLLCIITESINIDLCDILVHLLTISVRLPYSSTVQCNVRIYFLIM